MHVHYVAQWQFISHLIHLQPVTFPFYLISNMCDRAFKIQKSTSGNVTHRNVPEAEYEIVGFEEEEKSVKTSHTPEFLEFTVEDLNEMYKI